MQEQVILLNGPSSSGKSTLAKSLQQLIEEKRDERYEIISIDDFLKMTTKDVIYEEDVFDISLKLCDKVLEVLISNKGAIIDHVITSERIFNQLKEKLSSYHIHMIHVSCPLNILKKREVERNNRRLGSAEASYDYLYPKEGYDLSVDTYTLTTENCSFKILEILS
jgi:chloramphenicol 3-O phosphotransferase